MSKDTLFAIFAIDKLNNTCAFLLEGNTYSDKIAMLKKSELVCFGETKDVINAKNLNDVFDINLKLVNKRLWYIEDRIRAKEKMQEFDKDFIQIARSVYKENDIRSSIKKEINQKFNCEIIEEKSYSDY